MPSNHLILCHPLLLLPSIFPSIRVFSKMSVLCIRWPKYWSFSFSVSPSNEYSGLISFWFHLLAVQGTLRSLLQHHSSKASILWRSAFFIVQLSYPYMTTGKRIALKRQTFFGCKIPADGDCSHEIKGKTKNKQTKKKQKQKRAPWKRSYDQPRQNIENQTLTITTKVHLVKAMVFPVVMYRCES